MQVRGSWWYGLAVLLVRAGFSCCMVPAQGDSQHAAGGAGQAHH